VEQFAHIAQITGFVHCNAIMENNKRADTSPTKFTVVPDPFAKTDLNSFFPFDPYTLPLSQTYMQGVYREWSMVALETEEEEESDDDDGADVQLGQGESDGLVGSFGGMSISPLRSMAAVH